jgi:hypothetical protein
MISRMGGLAARGGSSLNSENPVNAPAWRVATPGRWNSPEREFRAFLELGCGQATSGANRDDTLFLSTAKGIKCTLRNAIARGNIQLEEVA